MFKFYKLLDIWLKNSYSPMIEWIISKIRTNILQVETFWLKDFFSNSFLRTFYFKNFASTSFLRSFYLEDFSSNSFLRTSNFKVESFFLKTKGFFSRKIALTLEFFLLTLKLEVPTFNYFHSSLKIIHLFLSKNGSTLKLSEKFSTKHSFL